jgi:hypothetical protein
MMLRRAQLSPPVHIIREHGGWENGDMHPSQIQDAMFVITTTWTLEVLKEIAFTLKMAST